MFKRFLLCTLGLGILFAGCGSRPITAADTALQETAEVCQAAPATAESAGETELFSVRQGSDTRSDGYVYRGSKDGLNTDGVTYFTFTQDTIIHSDELGETLLQQTLNQTAFYSPCQIQSRWVNEVLADLQWMDTQYGNELLDHAKRDKKEMGEDFYYHSHYVSRGAARHDDHIISLLSQTSVYSGGVQPYLFQTAVNLDMRELKSLTLEDVVNPDGCAKLYEMIVSQVEQKFTSLGENVLFSDYKNIIEDAVTYGKMTPYWYFNQRGIVIFFNPYELAPYASGLIKVELSYDLLNGILKDSYFPEPITGWVTNVSVKRENNENRKTLEVFLGEGETIYISLAGKATRVQLSEVSFVEQTAVSSTMLYSSNRVDDEVTLAITAAPDPEKIYAVEYYDESGEAKILYFRNNQILLDIDS